MTLASRIVREQHLIRPRPILPTAADLRRNASVTGIPVVTLAASASANVKGNWGTLIASTAVEVHSLLLRIEQTGASGTDTAYLMDIAIGPSGSPTLLVENFQIGYSLDTATNASMFGEWVPIHIPEGVEVIGRFQSATGGRSFNLSVDAFGEGPGEYFRNCTTYGANTADSGGVSLAVPGAINSKGAWTEISSAISQPIHGLGFGIGGEWQPGFSNATMFVDIGAGPAGSERIVAPDIFTQFFTSEIIGNDTPIAHWYPVGPPLGVGERLVARYQTTVTAQGLNLIVYGYS